MDLSPPELGERSRLRLLLEHLSAIEDSREPHRVAYPLCEILLLAVCGTIADCDDVSERSGAPFVCAYVDETTEDGHITGHTCVPASEADAAAGGGR